MTITITAELLAQARAEALQQIRVATERKDAAAEAAATARAAQRELLAASTDTAREISRATGRSPSSVAVARATHDPSPTPATLPELQASTTEVNAAVTAYQQAYADWRSLLLAEHARQLLAPTVIYRAASISKQMFSKLRSQAKAEAGGAAEFALQNNRAPASQPAAYSLPPDAERAQPAAAAATTTYGPAFQEH